MAIITISRGSYTYGKMVANKVAERLGYKCIGRELLIEASKEFNIPEIKLTQAISNAPSILDRFTYGKEKYIAYIQAAFLKQVKRDNVVYHGFAGHFFLKDIPCVLKIRVNADLKLRVKLVMEREGISEEEAIKYINRLDEERREWSKSLYGIDTKDSSLYELVFKIGEITVEDVVEYICNLIQKGYFKLDEECRKRIEDMSLSAEVKVALMEINPDLDVYVQDGVAYIRGRAVALTYGDKVLAEIEDKVRQIPGIKDIHISISSKFVDV